MIRIILQVFCAFFSGLMEGFAISNEFLPYGSPLLALLCLIPLYKALNSSKSYWESGWLLCVQALTVHFISSYWLANFRGFAFITLGASAFGTGLEAFFAGCMFYILKSRETKTKELQEASGLLHWASFMRIIYFTFCFVIWEWVKSTGFLGYPWGTLPGAAYKWKILNQIADVTGVWGISFIYAFFSAFVGEGIILLEKLPKAQNWSEVVYNYRQSFKLLTAIFTLCFVYGLIQYFIPRYAEKYMNIVAVQQNIDPWEGGDDLSIEISMNLTEEAVENFRNAGEEVDLVLWSEGVLEHPYPSAMAYYESYPQIESLGGFINRMNVPFIIGGTTTLNRGKRHYGNSALLFDANGKFSAFYSKIHLVPFAEAIPFQDSAIVKFITRSLLGGMIGTTSGNQIVVFEIPLKDYYVTTPLEYRNERVVTASLDSNGNGNSEMTQYFTYNLEKNPDAYVKFTTPICFEDSFNDVCRKLYNAGTEIFLNITNDSWSKTNSSELQHFVEASYRSIEYRTTMVRCANAGYTVVIDPTGKILDSLPLFTEGAMCSRVPVYAHKPTIYARCGDWFVYTIAILTGLYFVYLLLCTYIDKITIFDAFKKSIKVVENEPVNDFDEETKIKTENILEVPEVKELKEVKSKASKTGAKTTSKARATVKAETKSASKATAKSSTKTGTKTAAKSTTKSGTKTAAKSTTGKTSTKTASKTAAKTSGKTGTKSTAKSSTKSSSTRKKQS